MHAATPITETRAPGSACIPADRTSLDTLADRDAGTSGVDVIIIGAGPIGLMLANLLGARGVRTQVFDLRAKPLESSMAIGVTPPSLEILRRLGLDETFRDAGVPVRHAEVHESRQRLGRLDFAQLKTDYPFFLSIPQAHTVEILFANLRKYSCVEVHPGVEFTGLQQDGHGVTVGCRNVPSQAEFQVRAKFLIGCDGHRSAVRNAAGLTVA